MSLVLIPVKVQALRANGTAVADATVRAVLTVTETDDGLVVPASIEGVTDGSGEVTLNLWPNSRGINGSQYRVEIEAGTLYFSGLVTVPEAPSSAWPVALSTLINEPPYPSTSVAQAAQAKASAYMLEAKGARDEAVPAAALATAARDLAVPAATAAQVARVQAEAARDSVNTTAKVFADTTAGLAGTSNAQTFAVLSGDLQSWIVYKNNAGVAQEVSRTYTKAYHDSYVARAEYRGWLYAVTDVAGKLAFGVTKVGKFVLGVGGDFLARILANETEIAAQGAHFVRTGALRSNKYVWMVVDAAKSKVALAVDKAGNLLSKGRDVLAEIDANRVLIAVTNATLKADGLARSARVAIVDAAGKAVMKVSRSGRVLLWDRDVLSELDALAIGSAPSGARENSSYAVFPFVDGAGKRQLKTLRKSDGAYITLTTAGNNVNPALTTDNKVLFVSDASGSWVQNCIPAEGGTPFPAFPLSALACWGDSLTAGAGSTNPTTKSYPGQLSALLGGRTVFNGGIGGQTSLQIMARQGGALSLITVAANLIPASGGVAVTDKTVNFLVSSGSFSGTQTGTLAGVLGAMTTDASGNWTFTRAVAGAATACPAGTPFIPTLAVQHRGETALLIIGRNDSMSTSTATHLSRIQAMVDYLTPYYKNFAVGLVLNSISEGIGSSNYNSIKARNDAVKAAYPNNWFDTQSPPTDAEMALLGFVPDSGDMADIANGCIPTHMRNFEAGDPLHLNDYGYALWAIRANNFIQAKGW